MGGKIVGVIGIVLVGIILADIWAHPQGVAAGAQGINAVSTPAFNAMLGQTSTPGGAG